MEFVNGWIGRFQLVVTAWILNVGRWINIYYLDYVQPSSENVIYILRVFSLVYYIAFLKSCN